MRLLFLIEASESSSHIKRRAFLFCFVFYLILKGSFRYHDSYAKNEGVYGAFHYALEVGLPPDCARLCRQKPKLFGQFYSVLFT